MGVLRPGRGDDGHPRRPRGRPARPPRHHPPRAGRRVHGRRLRPAHRALRRRDGDARPGRHEPRHRHRGRVPRPGADGRDHRPDGHRQGPQGVAPVRRHPADARAGDEVDHPRASGPRRSRRSWPRRSASRSSRSPGPTHIELPEDVAASVVGPELEPLAPTRAYFPEPTDEAIAHAASLIAASARPIVLAGNGVLRRHASAELRAFARGLHVPVAATFMGKGAIDDRSHLSLMAVGLQARDHVLSGFDRADLVIAVGYDQVEYAPERWNPDGRTRILHIDTHAVRGRCRLPARGGADRRHRRHAASGCWRRCCRTGSAAGTPPSAMRRASCSSTRTCATRCSRTSTRTRRTTAGRSSRRRRSRTCAPSSRPEDVVVSDVGAHKVWVARLYQAYEPNTVIISNGFASMGIALPGAIAAALVHPDRRVVALCGDGGFLMNVQELETAVRLGVKVTVVVWRDDGYGLIDWKQRNEFGRPFGVEFGNPDFVALARSFGMAAFRPESSADLAPRPAARARGRRAVARRGADRLPREPAAHGAARGAHERGLTAGDARRVVVRGRTDRPDRAARLLISQGRRAQTPRDDAVRPPPPSPRARRRARRRGRDRGPGARRCCRTRARRRSRRRRREREARQRPARREARQGPEGGEGREDAGHADRSSSARGRTPTATTVYTLTVGSTVYDLHVGPPWWWGDANPLKPFVGDTVTVTGDKPEGANEVDVRTVDGNVIREPGKPPWAGGWKVVGREAPRLVPGKADQPGREGQGEGGARHRAPVLGRPEGL